MRGKQAKKIEAQEDPKFKNKTVGKFINLIMKQGKKTVAQKVIYTAFEEISEKTKKDPIEIFEQAIRNVSPVLEVKSRRIGGANYQIPVEVKGERKLTLAMRWIISAARNKKGMPMSRRLANEFMDAANKQGEAMKKKEDVHKMAESNRAFAHFG